MFPSAPIKIPRPSTSVNNPKRNYPAHLSHLHQTITFFYLVKQEILLSLNVSLLQVMYQFHTKFTTSNNLRTSSFIWHLMHIYL